MKLNFQNEENTIKIRSVCLRAVFVCISFMVAVGVMYALSRPATAMDYEMETETQIESEPIETDLEKFSELTEVTELQEEILYTEDTTELLETISTEVSTKPTEAIILHSECPLSHPIMLRKMKMMLPASKSRNL